MTTPAALLLVALFALVLAVVFGAMEFRRPRDRGIDRDLDGETDGRDDGPGFPR